MTLQYIYKNLKKVVPKYIFNELKDENLDRFEIIMDIDPKFNKLVNKIKSNKGKLYFTKQELIKNWYIITAHNIKDMQTKPMAI